MKGIKNLLGGLLLVIVLIIMDREIGGEKPVSTKRNSYVWAWVCILALALLGLANKCVNAQNAPVFYAPLVQGIIGQTVCDKNNNVVILVNSGYELDSTELRILIAHERVHADQVRTVGCVEAGRLYKLDPLSKEIPAFCEELKSRMVNGDAINVVTTFILYLQDRYTPNLTTDQIMDKVEEFCLGRKHDPP
jgi:hypothetical protein